MDVPMWHSLNPTDRLTLTFMVVTIAVALLCASSIPSWPRLMCTYGLLTLFTIAFAVVHRGTPESGLADFLHSFMPIIGVLVIFNSLGDIIPFMGRQNCDGMLIRIDHLLFAAHPTVWLERFNSARLTALFQVAYISYYFVPIALVTSLFVKARRNDVETAVFGLVLCFYLSYIGYMLFPAVGPRYTLSHLQTSDLPAGPLTLWVRQTLDSLEHNKTDAFPSGHTAVALVALYYAWKLGERVLSKVLVPAVSALILSTVYLRYHYVVDVLAGILLALLTVFVAPPLQRLFSGLPRDAQG